MKNLVLLTLLAFGSAVSHAQNNNKKSQEKLLKELADNACGCVDSVQTFNRSKESVAADIGKCIDKVANAYQLGSKLIQIKEQERNGRKTEGRSEIALSVNVNKESAEYKEYYYEAERYMRDHCQSMSGKLSANDEQGDASLSENRRAMEYYRKGVDESEKENYRGAIPYYEKAVQYDSAFANAWDNLGVCYRRLEQYDKAIDAYKKSLAINPRGLTALQNIAVVYRFKGEYQKSIQAYQQLATAEPDNPEVFFGIGQLYFGFLSDPEKGLENMCKAYNLYVKQKSPYRSDAEKMISAIYRQMKEQGKEAKFKEILEANHISPQMSNTK